MEKRYCKVSGAEFSVSDADKDFYARLGLNPPTLCPEQRMRRRLSWRNERSLYKRLCDKSAKSIVSVYPEATKFPVYAQDIWWSDCWDPLSYGRDYDFSRSFYEQFFELFNQVPRIGISNRGENSDYCNWSLDFKDSYMCVSGIESESCSFCYFTSFSFQCVDCSNLSHCQFCYDCIDGLRLYECISCQDCEDCHSLTACKNCISCNDCIGCVGLYKKQYHVFNQAYSKQDYLAFKEKLFPLNRNSVLGVIDKREQLASKSTFKYYHGHSNDNFIGDYITHCRDVFRSFDISESEEVSFSHNCPRKCQSSYDCCFCPDAELLCEVISASGGYKQVSTMYCWDSSNIFYSDHCMSCSHILGSIGLRNKKYCIINKQYSADEYQSLSTKIIEQLKAENIWGEFFPAKHSPFAYNESVANDYFPANKESIEKEGLRWKTELEDHQAPQLRAPVDSIDKLSDSQLDQVFASNLSGRPYKITKHEREFYRKMMVPLPLYTFDERMQIRLESRNPRQLWQRVCSVTGEKLISTYSPQRPEKIASEQAYRNLMFD